MALFTGKGDDGTTKTFGSGKPRISKSSTVAEALGTLDELNSLLGLVKVKAGESGLDLSGQPFARIVHDLQETLFIIQAQLAGADKIVSEQRLRDVEAMIAAIETELPPITSFFISGGTELAALFDMARTVSRRAERRAVAARDDGSFAPQEHTLPFLNRLSSILYALARLSNHRRGITEQAPSYS